MVTFLTVQFWAYRMATPPERKWTHCHNFVALKQWSMLVFYLSVKKLTFLTRKTAFCQTKDLFMHHTHFDWFLDAERVGGAGCWVGWASWTSCCEAFSDFFESLERAVSPVDATMLPALTKLLGPLWVNISVLCTDECFCLSYFVLISLVMRHLNSPKQCLKVAVFQSNGQKLLKFWIDWKSTHFFLIEPHDCTVHILSTRGLTVSRLSTHL